MAIYNGRILMRKGNEADFDASKLMSGEWAVSLDAGIVRICLEAGKVIRMATYEAFEEDMKQIEAILLECQTIEEAVQRINTEVNNKLNACAEYVQQAKNYSEQAKTSEANAKSSMQSAKTSEENAKVSETNAKASENSAKEYENSAKLTEERAREVFESIPEDYSTISNDLYELAIKETASGEEIHLNDSSNLKLREFALYGKAKQNTTSGKNLCPDISGTYTLYTGEKEIDLHAGTYTISLDISSTDTDNGESYLALYDANGNSLVTNASLFYIPRTATLSRRTLTFTIYGNAKKMIIYSARSYSNSVGDTLVIDNIQIESGTVATPWEEFSGGMASPNPSYPQPIEVSGESYNLLENKATSQTADGVTLTVNENKSITANGTANKSMSITLCNAVKLPLGEYLISGGKETDARLECVLTKNDGTKEYIYSNKEGEPTKFAIRENVTSIQVLLVIISGIKLDNYTFYPMIRKASVKNDRYMPFGVGSVEVKSVGSQLFDAKALEVNSNNIIELSDNDYVVTVIGGNTGPYRNSKIEFPVEEMRGKMLYAKYDSLSASVLNSNSNVQIVVSKENGEAYYSIIKTSITEITIPANAKRVYLGIWTNNTDEKLSEENIVTVKGLVVSFYKDAEWQPYKETLSTIPTNGLAGIKVDSGGNYTDQNGQQWICDEVVKYADGSGKKVKRFNYIKVTSIQSGHKNNKGDTVIGCVTFDAKPTSNAIVGNVLCNRCVNVSANKQFEKSLNGIAISSGGRVDLSIVGCTTVTELRTYVSENDVYILYELATPIETPLTAEEIAEIEKLHTFYPVTNISNDFDCGMSVTYYCDSKNYIDNQLAIMKQEQEEAMMNMLLLMPTEVQAMMIENDTNDLLKESEI